LLGLLAGPQELPTDVWGSASELDVAQALAGADPLPEPPLAPPTPAPTPGAADLDGSSQNAVLRHVPGVVTPGDLTEGVQAGIEQQSRPLRACYGALGGADAAGAYVGQLEVAADGSVSAVSVAGPDAKVAACMERKVRSWRLPAGASVRWTWALSSE
jgi:hypothetical protein